MSQRQAVNPSDTDGVQHQGERTWYVYDAGGQRVRKVTELATGAVKDERTYLGGFEIYRRHCEPSLVRETLHIMDAKRRIALVETRADLPAVEELIRYQLSNHLDSASLELDDQAQIMTCEEYSPYGSTSYQATCGQTEAPKRYRYTGKERDLESGLSYHGARYYASWLGRWVSPDPIGMGDGVNAYSYVHNRPLNKIDVAGTRAVVPGKHVVAKGDTFWGLETQLHYKHGLLQRLNPNIDPKNLNIGSLINLPGGPVEQKQPVSAADVRAASAPTVPAAPNAGETTTDFLKRLTSTSPLKDLTGTITQELAVAEYPGVKLTFDIQRKPVQGSYNYNVRVDNTGKFKRLDFSVNIGRLRTTIDLSGEGSVSVNYAFRNYRFGSKTSGSGKTSTTTAYRNPKTGFGWSLETDIERTPPLTPITIPDKPTESPNPWAPYLMLIVTTEMNVNATTRAFELGAGRALGKVGGIMQPIVSDWFLQMEFPTNERPTY